MRVAYCILCHRNNIILRTLVELLSKDNDVYIHVDAKSDVAGFAEYRDKAIFIEEREESAWGSFATVKAIEKLLCATCITKYDYVLLLSGDDLPLRSNEDINKLLKENYGAEYVGITRNVNIDARVEYIYPKSIYFKKKPLWVRIRHKLKLYKKNPNFAKLPKLYKGCLWFTITAELRDYILRFLSVNTWYSSAFEHSLNADEVFFHTIICNSEFKNKVYMYDKDIHDTFMCLRYIDWFSGPERPRILDESDYRKMQASGCLFARKLNENIDINKFKNYFELE